MHVSQVRCVPQTLRAWVRSSDGTNFASHLELSGWITETVPNCNANLTCKHFLATVATSFTATNTWQLITVVWWPPNSGDLTRYTDLGTFQAAIVPDVANKSLLVDEAVETGPLVDDVHSRVGEPPAMIGFGPPCRELRQKEGHGQSASSTSPVLRSVVPQVQSLPSVALVLVNVASPGVTPLFNP